MADAQKQLQAISEEFQKLQTGTLGVSSQNSCPQTPMASLRTE